MENIEWGPVIPVDGKRPEWLEDGVQVLVHWSDGQKHDYPSHCIHGWDVGIPRFQLPADHPHYPPADTPTPDPQWTETALRVEAMRLAVASGASSPINSAGYILAFLKGDK